MSVMIEKVNRAAERLATSVSRREFLGKLSRAALTVTSVLSGLLALPADAQAGKFLKCCAYYTCEYPYGCFWSFHCTTGNCPKGAGYRGWSKVENCTYCSGLYGAALAKQLRR